VQVIYSGKHSEVTIRNAVREEVFGIILAVVTVRFVNERFTSRAEHPPVVYNFSDSWEERRRIMAVPYGMCSAPFGMCSINEVPNVFTNYHLSSR
jgi:hypothetical protein